MPFQAGVVRLSVARDGPLDAYAWYPTEAAPDSVQVGPFTLAASRDAPVAPGARFPVVLLSHGGGGTPLLLRELSAHLARSGFVVVAPIHVGDLSARAARQGAARRSRPLADRPHQARQALDAVLADPRFAPRADPARLGMIGFSLGGYTTLVLAGARPDLARWAAHCREHGATDRARACAGMTSEAPDAAAARLLHDPDMPALAFKALVLLDPFAVPFGPAGLAALTMPILLVRPERDDVLPARFNALALASGLPRAPTQATVPGGHFVVIGPCPPALAAEAPEVCVDAPGIDRSAVARQLAAEIAAFLRRGL